MEAASVESLAEFDVLAPEPNDRPRVAELVRLYAAFPLGAANASSVAPAERLDIDALLTLDRGHFPAIWPATGLSSGYCPDLLRLTWLNGLIER